jgi:enediyne biosynthesis protein E7
VSAATRPDARPLPPGPEAELGLDTIRDDPLGFLEGMTEEYGDVSYHRSGGWRVTIANSPALARHVLRENRRNYTKAGTPDEAMLVPLLGRGLLTSEGDLWKRQRQLVQPDFRPHRVARFDGLMTEAAVEVAERWLSAADGGPIRVDRDLTALTLAVVARAILGSDVSMGPRFGEAVDAVNRFMSHYDPGSGDPEIARDRAAFGGALAFLDGLVRLLVDARRFGGEPEQPDADLLDALLRARTEAGDPLPDREIRDQVLTILMAGHETTAKALTWTLYLLDRHPHERERVEAEVDAVLGGRLPTAADAERLPACRNAVAESLRLYPPVWLISRLALEADELAGYRVEPGTLVCISPYLLHRHPAHWEHAGDFDPSRFDADEHDPFAYIPFSGGPRQCIGRELALLETQLVLAVLCSRLRASLVPGHVVEAEALVTLRPKHGLVMSVEPR